MSNRQNDKSDGQSASSADPDKLTDDATAPAPDTHPGGYVGESPEAEPATQAMSSDDAEADQGEAAEVRPEARKAKLNEVWIIE
ncbi:hypothetical protein [Streptomyces luteolus]|uniref:Uncharacterized protein n=1 Tax=Streptomyces luteolus TaxID=3043615 RepID=A0ABT6SZ58_9ACTN|nr:hypothetical protein [Streptomyces sp. B-S-A12]MDI3420889.1 hypothetical protein [Streptomyces sp. B-S-A12]